MFFRRKTVTLESLADRLTVLEMALGIYRGEPPKRVPDGTGGQLGKALADLGKAVAREEEIKRNARRTPV